MPSFKNLEMATAVSSHQNIEVKKSLFSTKVVYKPTQSTLKIVVLEYTPNDGERVKYLLSLPVSKMAAEIEQKGKPATTPIGHYRLEVCVSDDHQFCAMQLFCFVDFRNNPVDEPHFYEGADVESALALIQ